MRRKRFRWFSLGAVGLALVLVLSGCAPGAGMGPDGGDATSDEANDSATAQGDTAQRVAGKGMIEIGELRYELAVTRCTQILRTVGGDAESVTEPNNVQVYFEFPPNDWTDSEAIENLGHTGLVKLRIEDVYANWVTSPTEVEDMNLPHGVDAADVVVTELNVSADGQTMEGKATFLEVNQRSLQQNPRTADDDRPTEAGYFSFSCPSAD